MRKKKSHLPIKWLVGSLLMMLGLSLLTSLAATAASAHSNRAAEQAVDAVWQRVRQSGAYQFGAEVTQTQTPRPTVVNAGRESKSNTLYLEGDTDLNAESLKLRVWSGGGSVLAPETAVEVKVDGQTAQARKGGGAWEEIDDFSGLFAPNGDFMAYTRAAKNVVAHEPEVLNTIVGQILVTRYTFDIDGYEYAQQMRGQLREQAVRDGLPPGVELELPRMYTEMSGTGELLVGENGFPLRQEFALSFPESKDNYVASAQIRVDFSDFSPLPALGPLEQWQNRAVSALQSATEVSNLLLMSVAGFYLLFVFILVARSYSQHVYRVAAVFIIIAMLFGPLVKGEMAHAYSSRQVDRESRREKEQAERDAQQELQDALKEPSIDPHTDPLARAQQQAAFTTDAAGINEDGRYFDPSCSTDPDGDIDNDKLTNLEECLLGTLPDIADTDTDGVDDGVEVAGFQMANAQGQMVTWYTNPLDVDTNKDGIADGKEWYIDATENGIPDDTDGDGTPDLWDDDNDGDNVPDDLDLSAYANSKDQTVFNAVNPFELVINDLSEDKLVTVAFQLSPTDASHLWYSKNVLDWPVNDRQGQLQDVDGATFFDVDPSISPIPNTNGDMRLVPVLAIDMPLEGANLPSEDILEQFGVVVRQISDDRQTAYVPLELVTDSQGDAHTGFYGRMVYRSGDSWPAAHEVRLVWLVEMLNDICGYPEEPPTDYPPSAVWPPDPDQPPSGWSGDWPGQYSLVRDGLCQFYESKNELQVVQSYDDEWFLTGLMVTEDHNADIALIYEDPVAANNAEAGYDAPFYMDTLFGLVYSLDHTFLAGRDCDAVDGDDNCLGNGERDIKVANIAQRFDHRTNSSVSAEERWNLPNVLNVEWNSYESIDLGLMDTAVTQTEALLDDNFTGAWSVSQPITPTVLLAVEQSFRAVNLDQVTFGSPLFDLNSRGLTLDLPQSGDNAVEIETIASLKWTPYQYDSIDGWAAADMPTFWQEMETQLGGSFEDLADPEEADTYHTATQFFYMSIYAGISNVVQIGDVLLTAAYATPDKPLAFSMTAEVGKLLLTGMKLYVKYSEALARAMAQARYALEFRPLVNNVPRQLVLAKFWQQQVLFYGNGLVAAAVFTILIVAFLVAATALFFNYALNDNTLPWNIIAAASIGALLTIITILNPILSTIRLARNLANVAEGLISFSSALGRTLAASSKTIGVSRKLGWVGLIISVGVAIGFFIWALASGKVDCCESPAFYTLLAYTIASIIITFLLFALSLTVVGVIIVGIITLVDIILLIAGEDFSITGWMTEVLATAIYRFNVTTPRVDSGNLAVDLSDESQGFVAGNQSEYTLPISTTYGPVPFGISERWLRSSFVYDLDKERKALSTSIDGRRDEWIVSYVDPSDPFRGMTAVLPDEVYYTDKLLAGVNQSAILTLNYAYALLGRECWLLFICNDHEVSGNDSVRFGRTHVIDVLPSSLDDFVAVSTWGIGSVGPVRFLDPDGDGLLDPSQGGLDPDNTKWDTDGDGLSDGYESIVRSRLAAEGGVNLDPKAADSDGDGVLDKVELKYGTDPGHPDSDGDGLDDGQEIPPHGGWDLPYRYDAADGLTISTRVFSDPLHADADGDGLSDFFEQSQLTCPDCNPWADPRNPELFSPNVWNESPVALYVSNNSNDNYVGLGKTFIYTTTTTNNLSGGQRVVGDLSLDLPDAFSGGPLSAQVDIQQGNSQSLVSQLTAVSSQSAAHDLASTMELTSFDRTLWNWDAPSLISANAVHGNIDDTAVALIPGSSGRLAVVTREVDSQGIEAVGYYQIWTDGSLESSRKLYVTASSTESLSALDIACNEEGVCLAVWGENNADQSRILAGRIEAGSQPSELSIWQQELGSPATVASPAVATDGSRFLVGFSVADGSGSRIIAQRVEAGGSQPAGEGTVSNLAAEPVGVDFAWDGDAYLAVWSEGGTMYRTAVDVDGSGSDVRAIGAGSGWPQPDGSTRAPGITFDPLSQQAALVYRSQVNGNSRLAARLLTTAIDGTPILIDEDVALDGEGVVVATSADPQNSGWVLAWSEPGNDETTFRALGPDGGLRGDTADVSQSSITAVGLSCYLPQQLLRFQFEEPTGASAFEDSSGNEYLATCSQANCPQSGVPGRFGNGLRFRAANETSLTVAGGTDALLRNQSFTVAAWAKREGVDEQMAILGHGTDKPNEGLIFGFRSDNQFTCAFFGGNGLNTETAYTDSDWHHWACTYDAKTRLRTIYRDREVVAQDTASANFRGTGPITIGRKFDTPWYFEGFLDEVGVWLRPLTADELGDLASTVTAVYSLDEVPGSTIFADGTGNGYRASCSGDSCPTLGVPGVAFSAASFDGQDDFIVLDPRPETTGQHFYDFESQTAPGWNSSRFYLGARNFVSTWFLGPFDNETVSLNLSNLPQHDTVDVSFDLYVAGEWAGARTDLGPHNWEWGYDNQAILTTNFSTLEDTTGNYQFYPDDSWTIDPVNTTNTWGGSPGTQCPGSPAGSYTGDTPDVLHYCADVSDRTVAYLYHITNYNGTPWPMDPKRNINAHYPTGGFIRSLRIWPAANKPRHGREPDLLAISGYPLDRNTVFHIKGTIPNHLADSIQFYFKGSNLTPGFQGQGWGIDNVFISTRQEGGTIPLTNASFTLSAWARRSNTNNRPMIISQGRSGQNQGLQFGFNPNNTFTCAFWGNDLSTSIGYTDTNWHHWSCTYDADTRLRTIYRDGVQIAQDTAANYTGFGPTKIGTGLFAGSNFPGTIDEVSIWSSALSSTEIEQLFKTVKVDNRSNLSCQLPLANGSNALALGNLTLRETTTELGEIRQSLVSEITIDTNRPTAEITSAYFDRNGPGDYVSSGGTLIIGGKAGDPTSYISDVEVNAGSGWETAVGTESWTFAWPTAGLDDGPQTLRLRSSDAVGNVSEESSWTTVLDTTPPTITYALVDGTIRPYRDALGRWLVSLGGTVADPMAGSRAGSGVTAVEILLQGGDSVSGFGWQAAAVQSDGTWQLDYLLPEFDNKHRSMSDLTGDLIVAARATDTVDNRTPATAYPTMTFRLDTVGPSVAASEALSNTQVIATATSLEGTVFDETGITAVEVNLTPAQQIAALDGTILHLPFDERHDTAFFIDQSGANNPATCDRNACPAVNQPGQRDRAITLDSATQSLSVPDLDLTDQSFTLAAWAKRSAAGNHDFIISQGKEALNGALTFGYLDTDQLQCGFWLDVVTTENSYADTQWHHVACTFDATSSTIRLYRDGLEVARDVVAGNYQGTGPLFIGKRFDESRHFGGSLDEITVYRRTLADYEIANLHAYGLGIWERASLNGGDWRYPIEEGDNGFEGIYQLNVRGIDILGNVTAQSEQRVWRGEIDTLPPTVAFPVETQTTGEITITTYTCLVTDFNLDGDHGCRVHGSAPGYRKADETFTSYDEVDPWYASVTDDSSRLYGLDAERTIALEIPNLDNLYVEVCDEYKHCATANAELLPAATVQAKAEVLSPSTRTVLESLEPITVSGHAFDNNGLQALMVTVNDEPVHAEIWAEGETTESDWQFEWVPPAEGTYVFELLFSDWGREEVFRSYLSPLFATGPADILYSAESVDDVRSGIKEDQRPRGDQLHKSAVAFLESGTWSQIEINNNDVQRGTPATLYVDLAAPTIDISPTRINADGEIGIHAIELTGTAFDDVLLHHVNIRVNGGDWQHAGITDNGRWQLPWPLPEPADGISLEVSVQAVDLAGRVAATTESVLVDLEAPQTGTFELTYIDGDGARHMAVPGDALSDVSALEISWSAATDGSGVVAYEVGFSSSMTPAPDELTRYAGPGSHVQPVSGNQRLYATVQIVDGAGNRQIITLGPIFVVQE